MRALVTSIYKKILRNNIVRLKCLYCYYIVICLFVISYLVVHTRYGKIAKVYNVLQKEVPAVFRVQTTTEKPVEKPSLPMKYILLWTDARKFPFNYFGEGNSIFVNRSCKWNNCYVTRDRGLLGSYTEFEVIVFNGPQVPLLRYSNDFPKVRDFHQKYVYANIESAANYPFRSSFLNSFFNWTWTYKLNSDAPWNYFVIKDANNNVIGPREDMRWLNVTDMGPINDSFKTDLQRKTKAAVWMASFCQTNSHRENYVKQLQNYLDKYKLKVDVFGECGDHKCPKEIMPRCMKYMKKHYYFYLAFENSFSDDYVTEKLFYALNYDLIPIVYGSANYSRFMPEGIYLDAYALGPENLAETMFGIINNQTEFYRYFRWKKYYSYHLRHDSPETDTYCNFCSIINNETLMKEHKTYTTFNTWWMDKSATTTWSISTASQPRRNHNAAFESPLRPLPSFILGDANLAPSVLDLALFS